MSTYITLKGIQVQGANCVAGLTYGFPAITHFLGYTHALSRKLEETHSITLNGCMIVCHKHQTHTHQPKGFGDYVFAQTRNPLTRTGDVAPIMEEGKMNLTVSLVVKCDGLVGGSDDANSILKTYIKKLCPTQKLAGGRINSIDDVFIESFNDYKTARKICYRLLPGFALVDRSAYLAKHLTFLQETKPKTEMIDAWLDFITLKHSATLIKDDKKQEKITWARVPKPNSGYLVPIVNGYRAISPVHPAGSVSGARDPDVPFCFVEPAYSLGEWQSLHRVENIENGLWYYQAEPGWYLCTNTANNYKDANNNDDDNFDFL